MIVATDDQIARFTGSSTKRRSERMPRKAKKSTAVVVNRGSQSHHTPHVGLAQIAPWQHMRNARSTPLSMAASMRTSHLKSPLKRKAMAQPKAKVMARRPVHADG